MWLFSKHGFYSVVADRHQNGRFLVWSRVRSDLDNLAKFIGSTAAISETRSADYSYRVMVERTNELTAVMMALARNIDYPNFKSRIGQLPGQRERLGIYHDIWAVAAKLQSSATESE